MAFAACAAASAWTSALASSVVIVPAPAELDAVLDVLAGGVTPAAGVVGWWSGAALEGVAAGRADARTGALVVTLGADFRGPFPLLSACVSNGVRANTKSAATRIRTALVKTALVTLDELVMRLN